MRLRVIVLMVFTCGLVACASGPYDPALYRYGNTNAAALDASLEALYVQSLGTRQHRAIVRPVIVVPEGEHAVYVDGRRYRVRSR